MAALPALNGPNLPSSHGPGWLGAGKYYGRIERKVERDGLSLVELAHGAGRRLPPHSHEAAFCCLVLSGAYQEQLGPTTVPYDPFTVVFHPEGLRHRDEIGPHGARLFTVELDHRWLIVADGLPHTGESPRELRGGDPVWLMMRLRRECWKPEGPSELALEALVHELLGWSFGARGVGQRQPPRWLRRVVERLQDDYAGRIRISDLAVEAGVHPVHVARTFRAAHGKTIASFLARLRVQAASRLLADSELPLTQIALRTGFTDQSHLTRVFGRVTGMTPARFRRSLAAGAALRGQSTETGSRSITTRTSPARVSRRAP